MLFYSCTAFLKYFVWYIFVEVKTLKLLVLILPFVSKTVGSHLYWILIWKNNFEKAKQVESTCATVK